MQSISAYVVDSDRDSRVRVHGLLTSRALVGRPFSSGRDFLEELPQLKPGIALIDIGSAGETDFAIVQAVARAPLPCPIIAMTDHADVNFAVAAIRRGAADFLVKPVQERELDAALTGVLGILERRRIVSQQVEADGALLRQLTSREAEILGHIAQGFTNKEIASRVGIGIRTVEGHRASIAQKLGVATFAAAVAIFVRHQAALEAHTQRVVVASAAT